MIGFLLTFTDMPTGRAANRAKKVAHTKMGQRWHRSFLKDHFTPRGARKYAYRPRSPKYNKSKLRNLHHLDPLRFTDDTMDNVIGKNNRDVRATSKSTRVVMNAPNLNRIPRLRDELTRLTQKEANILRDVFALWWERAFEKERNRRTSRPR